MEKLTSFEWACFSLGADKKTVDQYADLYKKSNIDKNFAETFHLRDELVFARHFENSARRLKSISLEQEKSKLDFSTLTLVDDKRISISKKKPEKSIPGRLLDEKSWIVHALKENFSVNNKIVDMIKKGKLSDQHLDIALSWINRTQIPIKNEDGSVSFHEDREKGAKILQAITAGLFGHKKQQFRIQQSCQRSLCRLYGDFDPAEMVGRKRMFAIDDVSRASLFEWTFGGRIAKQSPDQIIEDSSKMPSEDWPLYRSRVCMLLENAGYPPTSIDAVRRMDLFSLYESLEPGMQEVESKFIANRPTAPEDGQLRNELANELRSAMTIKTVYDKFNDLRSKSDQDGCRRLLGVLVDLAEGTNEGLTLFRSMPQLTRKEARTISATARSVLWRMAMGAQTDASLKAILNDFGSRELSRVTRGTLLDSVDFHAKTTQDQELLSRLSAFSLFYALDDRSGTDKADLAKRAVQLLSASPKEKRSVETGGILRANNVVKLANYLAGKSLAGNANKAIETLAIDPGPPEPGFWQRMRAILRGRTS